MFGSHILCCNDILLRATVKFSLYNRQITFLFKDLHLYFMLGCFCKDTINETEIIESSWVSFSRKYYF